MWKKEDELKQLKSELAALDRKIHTDQNSMLTSILTQKWIASTRCQAWDAWFDINRTGIPVLGTKHVDEEGCRCCRNRH